MSEKIRDFIMFLFLSINDIGHEVLYYPWKYKVPTYAVTCTCIFFLAYLSYIIICSTTEILLQSKLKVNSDTRSRSFATSLKFNTTSKSQATGFCPIYFHKRTQNPWLATMGRYMIFRTAGLTCIN